jgi:hypothetical protein
LLPVSAELLFSLPVSAELLLLLLLSFSRGFWDRRGRRRPLPMVGIFSFYLTLLIDDKRLS